MHVSFHSFALHTLTTSAAQPHEVPPWGVRRMVGLATQGSMTRGLLSRGVLRLARRTGGCAERQLDEGALGYGPHALTHNAEEVPARRGVVQAHNIGE